MKPKLKSTAIETCVYCDKPIERGTGVVVYPHPNWRNIPSGLYANGKRHPHCRRVDDSEYRRNDEQTR
jgi:hypothetical protein